MLSEVEDSPFNKSFEEVWNDILRGAGLEPVTENVHDEDELGEQSPVKARKKPPTPSRKEVEDHEVDHYP